MGCLTAKASGSVASFISPTVTPIESARVYFSPTQLGEGTPSPENVREIVGRTSVELKQCGKNLLNPNIFTNVGYIINGNIVADSNFKYSDLFYIIKGEYVFSGINGNSANSNVRIHLYDEDGKWIKQIGQQGVVNNKLYNISFEITDNISYIKLSVPNNLINGQIELGSTATPYQPYQGTTIPFSWKRLPDEYQEVEYIENSGTQYLITDYAPTESSRYELQYEQIVNPIGDNMFFGYTNASTANYFELYNVIGRFYGASGLSRYRAIQITPTKLPNIVSVSMNPNELKIHDITNSPTEHYSQLSPISIGVFCWHRSTGAEHINKGARIYYLKAYNGDNLALNLIPCYRKSDNEIGMYDTVSQTFYTNQGTGTFTKGDDVFSDEVYGGYVDLVKGEIVQESDIYIFDGTENIQGGSGKAWANSESQFYIVERTYQTGIPFVSDSDGSHTFCNLLKPIGTSLFKTGNVICSYGTDSSNGYTYKYIVWESPIFGTTVDECKAKLAELYANGTPLIFVGKIAQSFKKTYQLTPMQLQTLKNENTFWSDADSVEIDYDLAETFDIQKAKRKIIMNQPHIETLTGDVVSFTTDMKAPLKECKVSFMPVQEGSGDPSPSNVRNITGWNGVGIKQCKKNLIIEDDPLNPNANYGHNSTGVTKYSEEEQGFYDKPPGISYTAHATGKNGLSYDKVRLFIAPSDMTVVFSIEYKNVGTTYGIRLYKSSSRLTDIHGNADSTWHRYSQVISLSKGDYLKLLIYDKIYWRNIQVEIANSVTDYESYQGTTYSVDWTDDAGTVYGGYVDLVSGELVVTHLAFVMDGVNYTVSTGGAVNATTNMARAHSFMSKTGMTDLPEGKYNTGIYASNKYVIHGLNNNGNSDSVIEEGVYCGGGTPYVRVVVNADNLSDVSSALAIVNSINEWLQSNPVQICYQLAEPITYQLTPQQLITLKGQNNLWADTNGTTEIKFWKH